MKTLNTVAYFRTDLRSIYLNEDFANIEWSMLSIANTGVTFGEDICLFIDEDGSTKILKNRLGKAQNP